MHRLMFFLLLIALLPGGPATAQRVWPDEMASTYRHHYKGAVKQVTIHTYTATMVNGRAVADTTCVARTINNYDTNKWLTTQAMDVYGNSGYSLVITTTSARPGFDRAWTRQYLYPSGPEQDGIVAARCTGANMELTDWTAQDTLTPKSVFTTLYDTLGRPDTYIDGPGKTITAHTMYAGDTATTYTAWHRQPYCAAIVLVRNATGDATVVEHIFYSLHNHISLTIDKLEYAYY